MADLRPNIIKAAKMITDDIDVKLGKVPMDEKRPEYWMLGKRQIIGRFDTNKNTPALARWSISL